MILFPCLEKETESIIDTISSSLSLEILWLDRTLLALQQFSLVLKYFLSSISCRSAAYIILVKATPSCYSGYVSSALYVNLAILRAWARPCVSST